MRPFTTLTGIAAPLPMANVDTDRIIPARFLKTIVRTGLGQNLFHALRYDEAGAEQPEFVLNRGHHRRAVILIAHENFGCGSSREHAPWALLDFGIRCVVAPHFADIFHNNCLKNGLLPVALPRDVCDLLMREAAEPDARFTVDLERQMVLRPGGEGHCFEIDPSRRHALLHGLDEIAGTLERAPAIAAFEARREREAPWLRGLAR